MRDVFEIECRDLRTRIARSRRRFDRRVLQVTHRATHWLQLGGMISTWSNKSLVWIAATGYGLARLIGTRFERDSRSARRVDRWWRRWRVWAWRQRRSQMNGTAGDNDV